MCHITKFNTQGQLHKFKLESFEDFMISISIFYFVSMESSWSDLWWCRNISTNKCPKKVIGKIWTMKIKYNKCCETSTGLLQKKWKQHSRKKHLHQNVCSRCKKIQRNIPVRINKRNWFSVDNQTHIFLTSPSLERDASVSVFNEHSL